MLAYHGVYISQLVETDRTKESFVSIHFFQRSTDQESFQAGQVIFAEGQPGKIMYVVTSGEVEIKIGETVIETIGSGDILGEMALIDTQPRSATAIAKTDCQLAPIDEQRFTFLVQQTPYFALQVMRIMADRLRKVHAYIA
jgi:CRP-like cAMP-binding protein